MNESIIELAIEALERRREAIQAEIDALKTGKRSGARPPKWSAAARKAQRERMKVYWAKKKGSAKTSKPAKFTKPGPESAASRKAVSERMKAYWAKRKAGKAKSSE
jgi:hypothetical protein